MVKNPNKEILLAIKELEEKQTALFEAYHNESYAIQCKINELYDKMKEKK